MAEVELRGWGRFRPSVARVETPLSVDRAGELVVDRSPVIGRGLGRSYGDAAQLSQGTVVSSAGLRDIEWLDRGAGRLRAGAGVTIAQLIEVGLPHRWFVPVSPGTRQVTVGGAIAADIHGKNHHRDGSWCEHVERMVLLTAAGEMVTASPTENAALFWATAGGMGLTGLIVEADIVMAPAPTGRLLVETTRTADFAELLHLMAETDEHHPFSVAWADLMTNGRGVLTQARFAEPDELARPDRAAEPPSGRGVALPSFRYPQLPKPALVRAFNAAWWRRAPSQPTTTEQSISAYFHPLDAIANWNVIYGARGFVQWQIVVPYAAVDVLHDVARRLYAEQAPAFFAVIKRFRAANAGPLSFPMAGWTLALDLPADPATLAMLDRLDQQVAEAQGRVYLAKDARLDGRLLSAMYPRLDEWREVRDRWDPDRRWQSDLGNRLGL